MVSSQVEEVEEQDEERRERVDAAQREQADGEQRQHEHEDGQLAPLQPVRHYTLVRSMSLIFLTTPFR